MLSVKIVKAVYRWESLTQLRADQAFKARRSVELGLRDFVVKAEVALRLIAAYYSIKYLY